MDKNEYIEKYVDIDYIIKSKNTSIAFGLVGIVFLFLHSSTQFDISFIFLSLLVILISIFRFFNVKFFFAKKISRQRAARNVSITILLNGTVWSTIGFLSVLSYDGLNLKMIITFFLLLLFIAGSIVAIPSKRTTLVIFNLLLISPINFFCFRYYVKNSDVIFLLVFNFINFFYTLRQSNVVFNELKKRLIAEFELKKSLEELAKSKKRIEEETIKTFHASRLSSLGEMASGVAHEINNPLTIIQGFSHSILVKENNLDLNVKSKLTKIHAASERIAKIVKSMKLISSRNDNLEHESVRIDKILEISVDLFEERIRAERIHFQIINPNNPNVYCNPLQISQILINLLNNSLDALNNIEEKNLLIHIEQNHSFVEVRVINSGKPLTKEFAQKIFEPFFSTKSFGKGTGLGLSISQTLANNNGGSLNYEPYEGMISFVLKLRKAF